MLGCLHRPLLLLLPVAAALRPPWQPRPAPTTRVAVLGGGFAGLTAARTLAKDRRIEVLLVDQRDYFEYTPGILRAWVDPTVHRKLVNPIARLLRSKRARFQRVPPGCGASLREEPGGARPLRLVVSGNGVHGALPLVDYECDYVVLATGGEQSPISDDRQLPDGTVLARRQRLGEQVEGVLGKAKTALVVGGGLTGIELAAELVESLGPGAVTLAVGPTLPSRALYPGDPGGGVLPGFRDTDPLFFRERLRGLRSGAVPYAEAWLRARVAARGQRRRRHRMGRSRHLERPQGGRGFRLPRAAAQHAPVVRRPGLGPLRPTRRVREPSGLAQRRRPLPALHA